MIFGYYTVELIKNKLILIFRRPEKKLINTLFSDRKSLT